MEQIELIRSRKMFTLGRPLRQSVSQSVVVLLCKISRSVAADFGSTGMQLYTNQSRQSSVLAATATAATADKTAADDSSRGRRCDGRFVGSDR